MQQGSSKDSGCIQRPFSILRHKSQAMHGQHSKAQDFRIALCRSRCFAYLGHFCKKLMKGYCNFSIQQQRMFEKQLLWQELLASKSYSSRQRLSQSTYDCYS
ncbi:hypothetical protein FGO68_gene12381 [Halteria grandinella]|uniref:Uncharacterized protein n=1 Tax=Halteria grandinella TaxID=5974 RepID=A0A8J8NT32_HALGN|nr:hypothetical protein FGO68_gene12381 [Halteria grandinella]